MIFGICFLDLDLVSVVLLTVTVKPSEFSDSQLGFLRRAEWISEASEYYRAHVRELRCLGEVLGVEVNGITTQKLRIH